jgi:uncharacterized metal-binding protein
MDNIVSSIDDGKKIMEEAWLTSYQYIRLTDIGLVKGQTTVTDETIEKVYKHIMNSSDLQVVDQTYSGNPLCCK